jgi:lipopolysaccharide heptosyltransferase II
LKKFLLVNPFGIGDVLFTTPVIAAIKDNLPDSMISYWCNQRVAPILKNNPRICRVYALSRGDIKKIYRKNPLRGIGSFLGLVSGIKRENFDICIDFSLDHRYSLIAKILGIGTRIGFDYKNRGRFLTRKLDIEGYSGRHVVEYYLDFLRFIGIEPRKKSLELYVSAESKVRIKELFSSLGISSHDILIGIAPGAGASWGKDACLKHWPTEKFAELADRLIADSGVKVLILGDAAERPIADALLAKMRKQAIDLVGKTTLEELVAVINSLNLLVTNDGGPLHMAAALGVKTVSIFGPVDEKVYGPFPPGPGHIVIKKELPCRPCYKNFRLPACVNNRICIKDITAEEVFRAARRLI